MDASLRAGPRLGLESHGWWVPAALKAFEANRGDIIHTEEDTADHKTAERTLTLAKLLIAESPGYQDPNASPLKAIPQLEAFKEFTEGFDTTGPSTSGADSDEWQFIWDCWRATGSRKMCFTSPSTGNLVGLVNEATQVGDQIWIFLGADVPVILRPSGGPADDSQDLPTFELVGDACVSGLMNGEALQEERFQPQTILLC